MNKNSTLKTVLPVIGGALLLVSANTAHAQFTYSNRDMLAVFRQTGSPDLVVNLGQASLYYNLAANAPGSTITINSYTPAQFSAAFSSGAVGVNWAVIGGVPVGNGDATRAARTVWITAPRLDLDTQTTPYQRDTGSTQGSWLATIRGVAGAGSTSGAAAWGAGTPADPISNTPTVAIIPSNDPSSYTQIAGTAGNLNGTFGQGSIENGSTTPFSDLRSDLYEVRPGTGDSIYLGYFDLNSAGILTFTAVPEPSTYALMGFGILSLWFFRQRRSISNVQKQQAE
jgi:PEP-CTERM motif